MKKYNLMNFINISYHKKVRSVEKENICSPDSKERLHQAHQAVESDDRVQTNGSWKRSSLAEDYLPRFQVTFRFSLLQDQLFFCRIFDINKDGFIDKREFRWMTSSTVISPQVIQTVFQVLNHQRYLNDQISTFKALSKTYFFSVVKQ